jgi:flagellar basal-body rod protein FlgB
VLFDTTQLALQGVIAGASQRHEALAANLANAETPGYQRVDVDFHSTLAAALTQRTTSAGTGGQGSGASAALQQATFAPARDAAAGAVQADGNTVDADAESAKLAENALEQEAAVQVAQTRIHILESAMGVAGR